MKKLMAKAVAVVVVLSLVLLSAAPVEAVKPVENLASAQKVPWNLSAAVMIVPPYGSLDIPGSDTASKLIVNQPNGNTEVTITGAMNGLHPNTVYTVYLSNGYEKNIPRWSLVGDWTLDFIFGVSHIHDMTVTLQQLGGSFQGYGHYVPDPSYTWDVTGTVTGSSVSFHILYTGTGAGYYVDAVGSIALNGTMSGTWSNPSQSGTWSSTAGNATLLGYVGSGWPGLFAASSVPAFTFTTDAYGAGSWHVNLVDSDFLGLDTYTLSVWINEAGGTMLISDNFEVVVD